MLNEEGLQDCVRLLATNGAFKSICMEFADPGVTVDASAIHDRTYFRLSNNRHKDVEVQGVTFDGTAVTASVAVTCDDIPAGMVIKTATLFTSGNKPLCTIPVDNGTVSTGVNAVLNIKVNFGD